MIVEELVEFLQAKVVTGAAKVDNVVSGGYASDLLSNVMSQAQGGDVWITMHGHQNIVAVASLLGLSAVIVAGDAVLDQEAVNKAETEEIPILTTSLSIFQVAGLLYSRGIRGV